MSKIVIFVRRRVVSAVFFFLVFRVLFVVSELGLKLPHVPVRILHVVVANLIGNKNNLQYGDTVGDRKIGFASYVITRVSLFLSTCLDPNCLKLLSDQGRLKIWTNNSSFFHFLLAPLRISVL